MINSEKELINYVDMHKDNLDAIVVEGYDGVGKGRVLNILSELLSVTPYRPDYSFWQRHDHRYKDRWKVSGFFWDVYSHFNLHNSPPLLFDRGVISGAVYNDDSNLAVDYREMIRDMRILHILVECSEEDYIKFSSIRLGSTNSEDSYYNLYKYNKYTERYKNYFDLSGVDYVSYMNHFIPEKEQELLTTCEGCGHYSYGECKHPAISCKIDKSHERCKYSTELEVQDANVTTEMHFV